MEANENLDNNLKPFGDAFHSIGFQRKQIVQNYEYADLLNPAETRKVSLGIFGREPFDYKSACFAVQLLPEHASSTQAARLLHALGASQFFIILNGTTERWRNSEAGPELRQSLPTVEVPNWILSKKAYWNPEAILRIKSGFQPPSPEQIDFVDVGLIPALEAEASRKIDSLIRGILHSVEQYARKKGEHFDPHQMFKILFKLLTAKLLSDRGVAVEPSIDFLKPSETLNAVNKFYKVKASESSHLSDELLHLVSSRIAGSFSFKNLSVDTLTYVYENTFVSQERRKELGIHSTPSYLADFILANLPIQELSRQNWKLFDPMCGHGIFLIAAMRRFRDLLPPNWDGPQRHRFFTKHIRGIEIDAFAYEVACMCLTLADFPQPDGWDIQQQDVFLGNTLAKMTRESTILVGNPPFEDLSNVRPKTPKPKALLRRVLPLLPQGGLVGIVLPRSFLSGDEYKAERGLLLQGFDILNVTELPERVFSHATVETCIISARKGRTDRPTKYFIIDRSSKEQFRSKQFIPYTDEVNQNYFVVTQRNAISVPLLRELWDNLDRNPKLSEYARIHKGVEYKLGMISDNREDVIKSRPFSNSHPGLWNVDDDFMQFTVQRMEYFSLDKRFWRNPNSKTWKLSWATPKVIVPASRLSQSHWRFAAIADKKGLLVGRRFYALWPTQKCMTVELLAAFLNSPIAQAYCFTHSYQQDTPARVYESVPLPLQIQMANTAVDSLVQEYIKLADERRYEAAKEVLFCIDAQILKSYELSPRLERKLLDFFWGHKRRVPFDFTGYIPPKFESWIPLHIYISPEYQESTVARTLDRLPTIENESTLRYLEGLGGK